MAANFSSDELEMQSQRQRGNQNRMCLRGLLLTSSSREGRSRAILIHSRELLKGTRRVQEHDQSKDSSNHKRMIMLKAMMIMIRMNQKIKMATMISMMKMNQKIKMSRVARVIKTQ
jgi:hypothetical protein